MADRPLNYSTKIAAKRTVQECMSLLAEAGADAVAAQYRDKQPTGLSFRLETPAGRRDFMMPLNVDGVAAVIGKMLRSAPPHVSRAELNRLATREHALAVAWRVVRDWLEAQLALIAAEMVTLDEVMLPYLEIAPGQTLYREFAERHGLAELEG
jgi:hypothetical protein